MRALSVIPRVAQCFSLLVIALSFPTASFAVDPGPPSGLNVNVTNTPANPVPVTGSIGVSGGVTINNPTTAPVPVLGVVTVVNPANKPALTSSVDDPGRIAYQSFKDNICAGGTCAFSFPAVPANHRLVIQHVSSGELVFTGTPTSVTIGLAGRPDGSQLGFFAPFASQLSVFDQPVLYYLDAGETPTVTVTVSGVTFLGPFAQFITLSGYLLDCNVSPCALIAH